MRHRALLSACLALSVLAAGRLPAQRRPWTVGATCYEIFVRSFFDSNSDGIGDLRGITQHLDYINDGNPRSTTSLGARCIWLTPIMESPSYHGYDVSDYYRVKREYGTEADFKALLAAAHARGIRVLVDMVINHVSAQHPWFQAALRDTASPYRDLFRWRATPGPNNQWGNNNWRQSPLRDEYYYAFFWQGMPDLNYERPAALAEMKRVATFWLRDMGADGLRMDAVKFLVEDGSGRADDAPGTHAVLREYAAHVRRIKPGAFTVGEVFDSTTSLLTYYPDQLDSYFAFELADSIIASVRRGDARGLLAPVLRLQERVPAQRWSPFLRNHDQARTRTELGGSLTKSRLAAIIQLTLPGLPFVYYGEELGMIGAKPDEQIRTPMAWNTNGANAGFTTGTPWEPLQRDSLEANVGAQSSDSASMLAMYRRLIHARADHRALGAGRLIAATTSHDAVTAYVRRAGEQLVLVVANLGDVAVNGLAISTADHTLPPGAYTARDVLSGAMLATVTVDATGAMRAYSPRAVMSAQEALVLALTRVRRSR
jgi:glycosidase